MFRSSSVLCGSAALTLGFPSMSYILRIQCKWKTSAVFRRSPLWSRAEDPYRPMWQSLGGNQRNYMRKRVQSPPGRESQEIRRPDFLQLLLPAAVHDLSISFILTLRDNANNTIKYSEQWTDTRKRDIQHLHVSFCCGVSLPHSLVTPVSLEKPQPPLALVVLIPRISPWEKSP